MYSEQISNFYEFLPRANTLIQREQTQSFSLFPQIKSLSLPLDSDEQVTVNSPIKQNDDKLSRLHLLQFPTFNQIFQKPIYKANDLIECGFNNFNYGQLKIKTKQLKKPKTDAIDIIPDDCPHLHFQSRFQSGNLAIVSKLTNHEYNLFIQKDINTNSCTQWFYFRVNNFKIKSLVKFNILNFTKSYSAFEDGMKIVLFSKKKYQIQGKKWHHGCTNIQYMANNIQKNQKNNSLFYTLSFTYEFAYDNDEVFFAYCYPYTYSNLQDYLNIIQAQYPKIVYRRRLTTTCSGNYVELLSITNPGSMHKNKPVMYITARVHPGESVSSFVCEGFINFLLSQAIEAVSLRQKYVLKIIPMLNPDGVINGNYRCSMSGHDLNRQWQQPDKILHPQIYQLKNMIAESKAKKVLFLDLHGHSKKKGIFMYGCKNKTYPLQCKQIPYLLSKYMKHFDFYSCNYSMSKSKQGTARIVVWKQLNINQCYTIQHSFFGSVKQNKHFTIKDYKQAGQQLAKVLYGYFCKRPLQNQIKQKSEYQKQQTKKQSSINQILAQLYNQPDFINACQGESAGSSEAQSLEQQQLNNPILTNLQPPKLSKGEVTFHRSRPQIIKTNYSPKKNAASKQLITEKTQSSTNSPLRVRRPHQNHNLNSTDLQQFQKFISYNMDKDFMLEDLQLNEINNRYQYGNILKHYQQPSSLNQKYKQSYNKDMTLLEELKQGYQNKRRIHRIQKQSSSSSPVKGYSVTNSSNNGYVCLQKNNISTNFQMKNIVFPSALRNDYTNYQKWRKFTGEETSIDLKKIKKVGNLWRKVSYTDRSIKKQIRSVQKREFSKKFG